RKCQSFVFIGEPKIAMLSHENLLATAKGHLIRLDKANIKRPLTDRHCSFLPMAHIYERFILLQGLLLCTSKFYRFFDSSKP
ncbi:unnamed protein product, partial [Rotaria sp. Silwood1]